VAVEILPKTKWVKNYKTVDFADTILDEKADQADLVEVDEDDDEAAKSKSTLL